MDENRPRPTSLLASAALLAVGLITATVAPGR
jgi:hypothetical protein